MNLQINYIDIKNVAFSPKTSIEEGILYISKDELMSKISDARFSSIEINLTFPGESCRIGRVGDIIQPTVKIDEEEATFPGSFGEMRQAGNGTTVKLRGIAIVETYEIPAPSGAIIDMSGPGAEHTQFSKTINLVITALAAQGVDKFNYAEALKKASMTAAVYLAKAAKGCTPDLVENFNLDRDNLNDANGNPLPRVAYIYQAFSHKQIIENLFYGDGLQKMLPTIVHPNEILDGAIINRDYEQLNNADVTYILQNHPVILELYRRHGHDINFVGVVLSNTPPAMIDKKRNAMLASGLAKNELNADAVIITKEGGGHPQVDIALNCEMSEALGMKTQIIVAEFMTTSGTSNEAILFNTPKADAIVTSGCLQLLELPAVDRVIGGLSIPDFPNPLNEALIGYNRLIRGSLSQLSDSWYTSIKY